MPQGFKLSETLGHIIRLIGAWQDAAEERKKCDVKYRAVCLPGQYGPDSHAKNATEQMNLFDLLKAANKEVERVRANLLERFQEANHAIRALASCEGIPSWSIDWAALLEALGRLRDCVESTRRPLYLYERRLEVWEQDLDSLTQWHRGIKEYEDMLAARLDSADKATRAKPGGKKWKKAQKRMLSLLPKGKLPQTLRQATNLLQSEGFSYNTVRTAAHQSRTLRAHFKLGTATDDPNGTTRSLLDELAQQTDRRTEQAIRRISPQQRAKTEAQLREMPAANALELVKTLAHDPDAGRTADVAYIEEADQDHRDDDE